MIVPLAFWLFLLGAIAIGWRAGDMRDRKILLVIGGAAVLTAGADMLLELGPAVMIVGVIDLALLVIVWRYALNTDRHWPIWFAGIHAASTLIGIVALLIPEGQRVLLTMLNGFWAIPALLAMVIGLLADQRRGISNTTT